MIRFVRMALCWMATAAALAIGATASADYSIVPFTYPGAVGIQAFSINRQLQIPGNAGSESFAVGFVYDFARNSFTTLPPGPGDTVASPMGLNDLGLATGTFQDVNTGAALAGFLFDGSSYYATFNHPGVSSMWARGINNAGTVAGYSDNADGSTIAWLYNPATSAFTDLAIPGFFKIIQGINSTGDVVGSTAAGPNGLFAGSVNGPYGFVRSASGVMTLFRINGMRTRARGINDAGVVVGHFIDTTDGITKGFVTTIPQTGGYSNVSLSAPEYLVVPGASSTQPNGINNAGFVSGYVFDAVGRPYSGFVAMPPAGNQVTDLASTIGDFGLPQGTAASFTSRLDAVQSALAAGNTTAACGASEALINHAQAQSGKKLTPAQASAIIDDATAIRVTLGC